MLRLLTRNDERITKASLCRGTVFLSSGGPKISPCPRTIMCIRENSSRVYQIQMVKIKPDTAYTRTKEVHR